ncbi:MULTISPECIES: gamma-type small acid-soluble spore protein [Neobacillus]|jgi:small acid-soluble spore protein E (minor gamma-type SASP)|uniref:Small, acid-soluble spore protein gamma-type n=1 Tax=Neobacillus sedimentimangrovi TaxID=2699460 RepID=A0ABS8QNW5_9BACI|nr:gamma-type small acid-soluble spore protein [Neobacillus sedimentimangrovi]AIM17265.1 spore protein [Bacillus sp. X1(2014)]MCD4839999.1 gamma-type small acid-soluble spore protein [Neobacillus sedimentimangrovi]
MANNQQQPNKTTAGTNIQEVRQQNAQSATTGTTGKFGTEFAAETNAQEVKKQNQAAEARKGQNAGQFGQS